MTAWGPATDGYEEKEDRPVIQERRMEKRMRNHGMGPDYTYLETYTSLLEKSDTKIVIHQTQVSSEAPYTDTFEV